MFLAVRPLPTEPQFGEPSLAGWYIGLTVAFVAVVVVVVVVGVILALAARIAFQVRLAAAQLESARSMTQPLEQLDRTNETLDSILDGARRARQKLEER